MLALLGVVVLTFFLPGGFLPYRIDFDVYRTGAQVVLDGGQLYGPMPQLSQGANLPFTYPPIAALGFSILAWLPLQVGSTLFTLFSIGCLALVLWIVLGKVSKLDRQPRWWVLLAVIAVALWLGPVRETLEYGQINLVLMALIVIDTMVGRGRWWGGALIGLAVAIKLTPIVFGLWLLLRLDWRGIAMAAASFLGFTGLGFAVLPTDSITYWTETVLNTGRIGGAAYAANQSINAVLNRLAVPEEVLSWWWLGLSLLAGLLVAWVCGRLLAQGHTTMAPVVVAFAALLCSPVSWGHHWVWVAPMLVILASWYARSQQSRWLWLTVSGLLIFVLRPQWWFPNTRDQELLWAPWQHVVGSAYLVWALVALVMIGVAAAKVAPSGDKPTKMLFGSLFAARST